MEIDFNNPAVKVGFNVVQQIDKIWNDIANSQEAVDKKEAGIWENQITRTITIFFNDGHKNIIGFTKEEWIWYKFFKRRNLGLA